jgi:geranylgeranyl reductase family protein
MINHFNRFDIIVVGAGPAGSAAAIFATQGGLRTLLLDKATFPRDKVCGDALSGKSLNILRQLNLTQQLEEIPQTRIDGVIFSSPSGEKISVKFRSLNPGETLYGYVSKRIDFDHFLFQKAKSQAALTIEDFQTENIIHNHELIGIKGRATGDGAEQEFFGKIIIGADGYKSFISQQMGLYHYDTRHTLVALRAYYRGVEGLSDFIEIHFVKESLPGYFWIFPLAGGMANVGIGMRHLDIKKRKIDLFEVLDAAVHSPNFRERFRQAELVEKIKGWNLPTGSIFRRNHTDQVLLAGDAAGLIDPFTGEGIGNALVSAQLAVKVAAAAIAAGDTSRQRLSEYDALLKQALGSELKLSYRLQKIGTHFPVLLNLVIRKAVKSPKVAEWISSMIAEEVSKRDLTNPLTYLKLLWK